MATASPSGLDQFLNDFRSQVDSGFGLISGDVQAVLATLVVISIVATSLLWAIDENANVLASLVRKVLLVGFFAWLVAQWHALSVTVVEGFAGLGLKAGGGAMGLGDFLNSPSRIVMKGIEVCVGLLDYVHKLAAGPVEFFAHFDTILMALVACLGVLIAFIVLAVEVTVVVIEFHIVTLIAFVTIPFGVLSQTSFLSERAIGYVASVGIKLMALAIVISIGSKVFDSYTVSLDPDIYEDIGLLLGAVVMVMLALKIPAIAGALISGGPQLNAGSAVSGAAGLAAGVAGVGLAGRMAGGAAFQAVSGGMEKVAAARAASGGLQGGHSARAEGTGAAASPSQAQPHGAQAPLTGRGHGSTGAPAQTSDQASDDPSPVVSRARARRSKLGVMTGTSAVHAASDHQVESPGMPARPAVTDEEPSQ